MTDAAAILAALESSAETIRTPIAGTDGHHVVWRCWGSGEPLVLLHGGFGSWNHWVRNVEALSARYRVIAPDMAGQGDSDDPPHPFDADSLAAILRDGLDRIVGAEQVRIAAFSFGSIIGGVLAAGLGDRVISFTGVGAAGLGERGPMTQQMIRATPEMTPDEREQIMRHNLGLLMFADPANIDPLALHIQRINTTRNRIRSRPISLSDRLRREIPNVTGRMNRVWGAEDITAVGYFEPRHDHLRSHHPDAGIVILDGVGHWAQYEASETFNGVLLNLLSES
ncbi:MAG: alpha/beta fold hydrolase [Alphaproteobacteria bacterium]|nr:alpha/beta fold hydrolase [Alphaproteobacteria bacterium]